MIESPGVEPYLIPAHQQYSNPRATAVYSHWDTLPDAYGKIERTPFDRKPDEQTPLSAFEVPANAGEMYFARIRGFVHPPESGDYVFSITSDDNSDLFLSTDEDPANRRFITCVDGWSAPEDFSRKSKPVHLERGKRYYIEAVHRELDMGDHLRVAWAGPGVAEGIIAGANLSTTPTGTKGSIIREVWYDKNTPLSSPAKALVDSGTKPEAPITPPPGGIHVEAEDFFVQSETETMDCYTGGKQVLFPPQRANSFCGFRINVPKTGTYEFTARVATVNWGQQMYVRSFGAMYPVKEAKASNVYRNEQGLGPQQAIDQDLTTRWAMDFGKEDGWLELNLGQPRRISKLIVDERALNYICQHKIEYKVGEEWMTLMEGELMNNYVKSFDPVMAQYVRLRTFECRAPTGGPTVRDFSVGDHLDGNGFIEIPWTSALEKDKNGGKSGRWQTTKPMEMYLVKGEQTIWVCTQTLEAQRSVAMRWFQLNPKG